MSITISIGSGKGGVGKSVCIANIALLLARAGKKVCIVDFDLGGADCHILFGLFQPQYTLSDFLDGNVRTISETIHTFKELHNLQLIPGTGETLRTSNMSFQEKRKVLRAIHSIEADIILFDVGAGTSYHTLDFFMATDIQMCIALPEPTSIMDFYTFLQLATIRKILSRFLSNSEIGKILKKDRFNNLNDALDVVEKINPGSKKKAQESLRFFNPLLIINRVENGSRLNRNKLHKMASKYLGIYLPSLGDVPQDDAVLSSIKSFLPVVEHQPKAPAALAFKEIAEKLLKVIELYERKSQRNLR